MIKFSKSDIDNYIAGNDIEDFDIDELENDREFMLEVIRKTKDKNIYNLCSDELKYDYEFVIQIIQLFKDDIKFISSVANVFIDYYRSKNVGPMIDDENDRDVLDLLITMCELIPDKYDENSLRYRVILTVMVNTRLVEIEKVRIENENNYELSKNFGCGFIYVFDSFNSSVKVTDYFALEYLNNLLSKENFDLEEYLHLNFEDTESINKYGLNTILVNIISNFDSMLGSYVSTHLYLLNEYKKDVKYILNRWNTFEDRKNAKICKKICEVIQEYLECNYPESDIDSSSWIYYIANKLGITDMFLKFDGLSEEFVEGIVEDMDNIYFNDMKLSELKHLVILKDKISDILNGKDVKSSYDEDSEVEEKSSSCKIIKLNLKNND